jgi:hypothetical protein
MPSLYTQRWTFVKHFSLPSTSRYTVHRVGLRHAGIEAYVPLAVRRSRIVSLLWRHTEAGGWLTYDRACWLAKRLP